MISARFGYIYPDQAMLADGSAEQGVFSFLALVQRHFEVSGRFYAYPEVLLALQRPSPGAMRYAEVDSCWTGWWGSERLHSSAPKLRP